MDQRPYLSQLESLEQSVTNLASSLSASNDHRLPSNAEQISDANIAISREEDSLSYLSRSNGLTRQSSRSSRPSRSELRPTQAAASQNQAESQPYSDSIPSSQSLYDWAPSDADIRNILSSEDTWDPASAEFIPINRSNEMSMNLDANLQDLERNPPPYLNRHAYHWRAERLSQALAARQSRSDIPYEPSPALNNALEELNRTERRATTNASARLSNSSNTTHRNIPSPALLSSFRPHTLSTQQRSELLNYIQEQDAATLAATSNRSSHSAAAAIVRGSHTSRSTRRLSRDGSTAYMRARTEAHHARLLSTPSLLQSTLPPPHFDDTIHYLSLLRRGMDPAVAASEASIASPPHDAITSVDGLLRPAESSWLRVGAVFDGRQNAASPVSLLGITRRDHNSGSGSNNTRSHRASDSSNSHSRETESPLALVPSSMSEHSWRVSVNIHAVDWDNMTIAGTMEAFDVPDWQVTPPTSRNNNQRNRARERQNTGNGLCGRSIVTYVEGEIIDWEHHSLATEQYSADTSIDASHWAQLEPFKFFARNREDGTSSPNLANRVLSSKWTRENIQEKYILMRWKERIFISPQAPNARPNLTISGFYYVSLRRSDGHISALYYDPTGSPFQLLTLDPGCAAVNGRRSGSKTEHSKHEDSYSTGMAWGSYTFR